MALAKCAWASQSETKGKNGVKGDQTSKEVKRGNCYYFGQTLVIRPKSSQINKGKRIGKATGEIADNDCFGYGQLDRASAYIVARGINWRIRYIEGVKNKCNLDCSELAGIAVNFAYNKEIVPSTVYSGNIAPTLVATKLFKTIAYEKGMKLKVGDIIVNPGHHVIVVTKDGIGA